MLFASSLLFFTELGIFYRGKQRIQVVRIAHSDNQDMILIRVFI
jgi:hypothetical protein